MLGGRMKGIAPKGVSGSVLLRPGVGGQSTIRKQNSSLIFIQFCTKYSVLYPQIMVYGILKWSESELSSV